MKKIIEYIHGAISSVVFIVIILTFSISKVEGASPPSQYIAINGVQATDAEFSQISSLFSNSESDISIGIGFIISYLQSPPKTIQDKLVQYLNLSVKYSVPLIIQIDGECWWNNRSDLWNWWDPDRAGFNPENRFNVEWTDWTPDSAVKIGWRNWGRQLRVLPMPNLMSPEYRMACHQEMTNLIPIILKWWQGLPEEKKHLLIGIKVGWESSIGVNNWYYPGGNDLLNKPEANDPVYGKTITQLPSRGVTTIGYSAVSSAKIASSGPMKEEYQTEVVRRHLEDYCKLARKLGVPRDRLFTHCGGWSQEETLFNAALNKYSCPGWSFYAHAVDVKEDKAVMNALKLSDAPYWGAVEYLLQGDKTTAEWYNALKNAFNVNKMRYLCIFNWNGIKDNSNAINAIKQLINE